MRRLSTVIASLRDAACDLEMIASVLEDKDGMVPGRAHLVSQLRSAASDAMSAASRAENANG
jgi:hypothetical protein